MTESRAAHLATAITATVTFGLWTVASGIVCLTIIDHIRYAESMSHLSWAGHVALIALFLWALAWAIGGLVSGVKDMGGKGE